MLKRVMSLVAVTGWTMNLGAQGIIEFNCTGNTSQSPTATSGGLVFFQTAGAPVIDTSTDINAELVYGSSASSTSLANVVATLLLSASATAGNGTLGETLSALGDITAFGNGQLWDNSGTEYQFNSLGYGSTLYFEVFAWTGDYSSYAAAQASGTALTGTSGPFEEYLGDATYTQNLYNMPALVLSHPLLPVPEPSTVALVGLGGLALFGLRKFNPVN